MGRVIYKPHFASDKDTEYLTLSEGDNISEIMRNTELPLEMSMCMECFINGEYIPREEWENTYPKHGQHIIIAAVPRGGDNGKRILSLVAMVALTYVTFGFGAGVGTGLNGFVATAAGGVAAAGVFVAGTLAINALFPPPGIDPSGGGGSESPALSLQGQRNQIRPYQAALAIYGQHRIWPPNVAEPYMNYVGREDRWLYMLLDLGYGEVVIDDLKIGETPIEDYPHVMWLRHVGVAQNLNFTHYSKDVSSRGLAIDLKKDVQHIETTELNTDSVVIDFTFPTGLVRFDKKGHKETRECVFSIEWKKNSDSIWNSMGLADAYKFSRSDITIVGSTSNTGLLPFTPFNLNGVIAVPPGTNEGTYITYAGSAFNIIEDRDPVGTTAPSPIGFPQGTTTLIGEPYDDISIGSIITINGYKYTITSAVTSGAGNQNIPIDPPLQSNFITEPYIPDGSGWQPLNNYTAGGTALFNPALNIRIADNTLIPFSFSVTIAFSEPEQYDIRVTRKTDDPSTNSRYGASKSLWSGIRSQSNTVAVNFDEERTYLALSMRATDDLNGVIDTVNCVGYRKLLVGFPGTKQKTRNQAWIIRDILTGTATPDPITDADLNQQSFIDFAAWCDQNTVNSNSTEPQFRFDAVIDYETTVLQLAQAVASSARAQLVQRDGKWEIMWDAEPSVPVQLITPHNSWGFAGTRLFNKVPDAVRMKFVDPDAGWHEGEVIVYNTGFDVDTATNYENLQLVGVTRSTQAWRDGRYHLAQAILRQETFTVNMDIENIVCVRGSFVLVQYDQGQIGGAPTRIKAISGTQITTREEMDIDMLETNKVKIREVRNNSNDIVEYDIVSKIDEYNITVDRTVTASVGDLLVHGIVDYVTDEFLVESIIPGPDFVATLTLIPLGRGVYTSDTGPLPVYNPQISPLRIVPTLVVDVVVTQEATSFLERQPLMSMNINWRSPDAVAVKSYEIYLLKGSNWKLIGTTTVAAYNVYQSVLLNGAKQNDIDLIVGEVLSFKIIAVGYGGGKVSIEQAEIHTATIQDDQVAPNAPIDVYIDQNDMALTIYWSPHPDDQDIALWTIKYTPFLDNYDLTNTNICAWLIPWSSSHATLQARPGTYLVYAVDTSGNIGDFTAVQLRVNPLPVGIYTGFGGLFDGKLWPGAKTNFQIVGDDLVQIDPLQPATYEIVQKFTTPSEMSQTIVSTFRGYGEAPGAVPSQNWLVVFEMQYSEGGWVMADWTTLDIVDPLNENEAAGLSEWELFQATEVVAKEVKIRFTAWSLDEETVVTATGDESNPFFAHAYGYLKNFTQTGTQASVTSGVTTTIFYDDAFYAAPELQITFEDGSTVTSHTLSSITNTSFDINVTHTGTGKFTWTAIGYGNVTDKGGL